MMFVYGQVESRLFPNNDAFSKISIAKDILRTSKIRTPELAQIKMSQF